MPAIRRSPRCCSEAPRREATPTDTRTSSCSSSGGNRRLRPTARWPLPPPVVISSRSIQSKTTTSALYGRTRGRSAAWATSRSLASRSTGATFSSETVERVLGDVVDLCDPDPTKQVAVGGILYSIPLHGVQLIANWQERAARYPDGLRVAVVKAHAQIEFLWRLDAYVARDNPVAGNQLLTCRTRRSPPCPARPEPRLLLGLQVPHGRSLGASDRAARSARANSRVISTSGRAGAEAM